MADWSQSLKRKLKLWLKKNKYLEEINIEYFKDK